jgi:hypothetical protein
LGVLVEALLPTQTPAPEPKTVVPLTGDELVAYQEQYHGRIITGLLMVLIMAALFLGLVMISN